MFYEESLIRKIFKCRRCQVNLDEQKPPRILPCGKTICYSCNKNLLDQANIKCVFCLAQHSTDQNGFIVNEVLLYLVNQKPKLVWRENTDENIEKFHKHSIVAYLFKCQKCHRQNYEYDPARVLPCCGKTVCQSCVDKIMTKVKANKLNCEICLKTARLASQPTKSYPS